MNRLLRFACGALALANLQMAAFQTGALAGGIPWSNNFALSRTRARASDKLMMVDVYTDWCVWCKKLDSDVYPDARVVQAASQFIPVRVNAEQQDGMPVAHQYGITAFPTILFINAADGSIVHRIGGYLPAPQFTAELSRAVESFHEFPRLQAEVKQHPGNTRAAGQLAVMMVSRGQVNQALALIHRAEQQGGPTSNLAGADIALADAERSAGRFEEAQAWYRKAIASSPGPTEVAVAHYGLSHTYYSQKNLAAARSELKAVIATSGAPAALQEDARRVLRRLSAR